ncbi:unnamed protein product [Dibothriocephalus latus]|uniref:Uncharacterized protein n=1 Tax=Dibothriocephalus latus TaxID=60516 RepID=A0A3P7NXH8_DIBLA|nr:unnamed protein product [Dibothriocephalus latus]
MASISKLTGVYIPPLINIVLFLFLYIPRLIYILPLVHLLPIVVVTFVDGGDDVCVVNRAAAATNKTAAAADITETPSPLPPHPPLIHIVLFLFLHIPRLIYILPLVHLLFIVVFLVADGGLANRAAAATNKTADAADLTDTRYFIHVGDDTSVLLASISTLAGMSTADAAAAATGGGDGGDVG